MRKDRICQSRDVVSSCRHNGSIKHRSEIKRSRQKKLVRWGKKP